MIKPERIKLANLPTPIFEFNKVNPDTAFTNLYIKRDDFSGVEMTGNKVRKLEFSFKEGLAEGAEVFITCGGPQSNHARATAAAAASLSKKSHLVLRSAEGYPDGNLFLDKLFGAEITFITAEEYSERILDIMAEIKEDYAKKGIKAYIMPTGASNGIGLFGYYTAFEEILEQEKQMGIKFDTICLTEGSGGTYAGLYAANEIYEAGKNIVGFQISDINGDVTDEIMGITEEALKIGSHEAKVSYDNIHMIYKYAGEGYAIASKEIISFIKDTAKSTGVVFDPVYTGKAFFGLINEIKDKNPLLKGNVLFIHTGGLYGTFPQKELFELS